MKEKEIYVTGSKGFIASGFLNSFSNTEKFITPEINKVDITDRDALRKYFSEKKITAVVNFAAMTDVDGAEKEKEDKNSLFWRVNVDGAENLANLALEKEAVLIQISTDFIFPGSEDSPGPYTEDSKPFVKPGSVGWYGWTKKVAEEEIVKTGVPHAIVRLAFPTGNFTSPRDYLNEILSGIHNGSH